MATQNKNTNVMASHDTVSSKAPKRQVPQLRFKKFEEQWQLKQLGKLGEFFSGGTPTSTNRDFYLGNIPFIGSGNIFDEKVNSFINQEALESSSAKMVNKGDLLYALYGANSGDVGISKINGAINQAILCIRPKEQDISFLFNLLTLNKTKIISKFLQGGQGNLSAKIVKKLKFAFPSLPEQQKIAQFLNEVDSKLQQLNQKKELLAQYKKGVMQQLLSHKIRFGDTEKSELRIGKLKDFGYFYYGKGAPKTTIKKGADTPCVRYGELYSTYDENITEIKSYTTVNPKDLKLSKGGEVLVPRVGEDPLDFANCSFLGLSGIAIGEMISVYNTDEDGLFMTYYINGMLKKELARRVEGGNVSNLYFRYVEEIEVTIPSKEEQQKIANYLSAIDSKIETVTQQIETTQQFKKGLLQQMFV